MFFIVFVLLFSTYFPVNSIDCMTNEDGSILSTSKCTFELNINDPIPDDTKLTTTASKCKMREANSIIKLGYSDGSCYGEISIDYGTKKMTVTLTDVSSLQAIMSPYDDMFGFLNGIKSVVQYKINGNLEKEKIQMTTRIQCDTYDNCALDKLRKLLPNLTISDTRQKIFKELIQFLNTRESTQGSELTCMNDDNSDVKCEEGNNRCKFDHPKKSPIKKGCASKDSNGDYDLEYRFNVIEEIEDSGIDNSASALKYLYLCNTDNCNSDDHVVKVDYLLNTFAMASKMNSQDINDKKPTAQTNSKGSTTAKSDGVSFIRSFYYRSIIIFLLIIQMLSN